jgi:hypothetical protein
MTDTVGVVFLMVEVCESACCSIIMIESSAPGAKPHIPKTVLNNGAEKIVAERIGIFRLVAEMNITTVRWIEACNAVPVT